jgi:hypothetical protein
MIKSRIIHLKVKIKSLAAEAGIIRHEVAKLDKRQSFTICPDKRKYISTIKHGLNEHRKGIVRYEARHSLLAYALLRGKPYEVVEQKCSEPPQWRKVTDVARRFGATQEQMIAWIENAKAYLKHKK